MDIAILKMNLIRSVVGAHLFYFRKKVIAVISAPVLYLGQCAYRGAIAQLPLVETVSKEKVFFLGFLETRLLEIRYRMRTEKITARSDTERTMQQLF